jgi:hypothetical protein
VTVTPLDDGDGDWTLLLLPPPPHALKPSAKGINTAKSRRRQACIPFAIKTSPFC